jgi:predicted RNase H-like nuclease (RuvC/YqgF family)
VKKKETKPRKPTRTQQLELDKGELVRTLERESTARVEAQNNYYKTKNDLTDERALTASLRGEVRSLKTSVTNLECKYMEQKGRADALELALRFAQKVPEKSEKGSTSSPQVAQVKSPDATDAAAYISAMLRRPY